MSLKYRTWIRTGESQNRNIRTLGKDKLRIKWMIWLYCRHKRVLDIIKPAIHIRYYDFVHPEFVSPALDKYFNRHIGLKKPRNPLLELINWKTGNG